MSVTRLGDVVHLEGDCRLEEAETLAALLDQEPGLTLDFSQCRQLHAAILQTLLVYRPRIEGEASDPFLERWILPRLREAWTGN